MSYTRELDPGVKMRRRISFKATNLIGSFQDDVKNLKSKTPQEIPKFRDGVLGTPMIVSNGNESLRAAAKNASHPELQSVTKRQPRGGRVASRMRISGPPLLHAAEDVSYAGAESDYAED